MRCPNCAANLPDDSWTCSECGAPVRPRDHVVRLELWGNPLQVLGWFLLTAIVGLRFAPMGLVRIGLCCRSEFDTRIFHLCIGTLGVLFGPWVVAAVNRWVCRNLRFSDGTRAEFSGRGREIFWWNFLLMLDTRQCGLQDGWEVKVLDGVLWFLGVWAMLLIIRWSVAHVELTNGRRFAFTGPYREAVCWELLLVLSVLTIIGWAWVLAALYRWAAESTSAPDAALRFQGKGHQILWRTLVALVLSILIIPIPWVWLWYAQWLTQNVTIEGALVEQPV